MKPMKFSETRQNVRDMTASAQTGKADKATCANLPSPLRDTKGTAELCEACDPVCLVLWAEFVNKRERKRSESG